MTSTPAKTPGTPPAPPTRTPPRSWLAWLPVALFPVLLTGGFVVGTLLLGDPNEPTSPQGWDAAWRVVLLWAALSILPALGIVWSLRAIRRHESGARAPLTVNALILLLFTATTLGGGLADAFT